MSWKSVTTFVTDLAVDQPALDAAVTLASTSDGHLEVVCLGIDPSQPDFYYSGIHAIALPSALAVAEARATELKAAVEAQLAKTTVRWSVVALSTQIYGLTAAVADAARFADVVVAARPYGQGKGPIQVTAVEAALFGAGVPVLVVPDRGLPTSFPKIAVAWNDSPEALRAVRTALPLLRQAGSAEVLIVDPPQHGIDRSDPGGRLAQLLARHGVQVEVRILARTLPDVAGVLARQLKDSASDLLVMGAYGHSRLRESILGGATRTMLEEADLPVLMVH